MSDYATIYGRAYGKLALGGICPCCASALAFQIAMHAAVEDLERDHGGESEMLATFERVLARRRIGQTQH